ncbi:MAG: DUF6151 family protein [Pseudomonadota bacterium]
MSNSHTIQCRCGQIRGLLTPTRPSNRCVCYCSDCQAFARHLQANDTLDERGGSEIIQVPPSNLTFTQGADKLACLRLTDSGMLRWYAACCNTPIGNTPANPGMSFVGLVHTCLAGNAQAREASFGPVTMVVGVKTAGGEVKPDQKGLFSGIAKTMAMIIKARLNGAYRRNPFFKQDTGVAVATPTVLSASELSAAKHVAS